MMPGLSPGSAFAGYLVEDALARGGMGVVYRARELRPERMVALKVIAPELAAELEFRARFLRESQLAAEIEHPHVVPVLRVGEEDGLLFIAMRLIRGMNLSSLITNEGRLPAERIAQIIDQIADALDTAHEMGLIHRDVKPANILVETHRRGDHAYLSDFGLTKLVSSSSGVTSTGAVLGTVDYMAPEQLEAGRLDARADIYSLGCMLFEGLTGRVPFAHERRAARMYAHMTSPPPTVSAAAPDVPAEFDEVVARALAKDPDDRYPSAGDLGRAALAAAQGQLLSSSGERSVAAGEAAPLPGATRRSRAPTTLPAGQPAGDPAEATTADAGGSGGAGSGNGGPGSGARRSGPGGSGAGGLGATASEAVTMPNARGGRSRRGLVGAAGAVLAILVVLAVVILSGSSGSSPNSGGTNSTGSGSPPQSGPAGVAAAWFTAYNQGDDNAALALWKVPASVQTAYPITQVRLNSADALGAWWKARGCHVTLITPISVSANIASARVVADRQRHTASAAPCTSLRPETSYDYHFTVSGNRITRLVSNLTPASTVEKWLENAVANPDQAAKLWSPHSSVQITSPSINHTFSSSADVLRFWQGLGCRYAQTSPVTANGNVAVAHLRVDSQLQGAPQTCTTIGKHYTAEFTVSDGRIDKLVSQPS